MATGAVPNLERRSITRFEFREASSVYPENEKHSWQGQTLVPF